MPTTTAPTAATADDQRQWDDARLVVERHIQDHERWLAAATSREPRRGAPFLFVARPSRFPVLVHRGAVVVAKGLAPLRGYLDDSGVIARRSVDVEDLRLLLDVFAAAPPAVPAGDNDHYLSPENDGHPGLAPRLDFTTSGAELSLFYVAGGGGGAADPSRTPIGQWILTIAPDRELRWSRRSRTFDLTSGQFVDVDHPR